MPLSSLVRLLQSSALTGELLERRSRDQRLLLRGGHRAARALVATALARRADQPLLVVVPTLEEAGRWTALLELMGWSSTQLYPTSEGSPYEPFDPTTEITWGQLQVLSELQSGSDRPDLAIVATERCLQPHLPPPQALAERCRSLRKGDTVEELTVERAAELLADRRAKGPAKKKATKKKSAKKKSAKKATKKKATKKKAAKKAAASSDDE